MSTVLSELTAAARGALALIVGWQRLPDDLRVSGASCQHCVYLDGLSDDGATLWKTEGKP